MFTIMQPLQPAISLVNKPPAQIHTRALNTPLRAINNLLKRESEQRRRNYVICFPSKLPASKWDKVFKSGLIKFTQFTLSNTLSQIMLSQPVANTAKLLVQPKSCLVFLYADYQFLLNKDIYYREMVYGLYADIFDIAQQEGKI